MVRTLVVFAVIIVGVVVLLPTSHRSPGAAQVDYSVQLIALRHETPFHIYAPAAPPSGWVANHVRTTVPRPGSPTATLDLGFYIAAGNAYVAVEQSNAPGWLATQLGSGALLIGPVLVDGITYQHYRDGAGQPALVRPVQGSLLVLDGHAPLATLESLAAVLT